MSDPLSRVKWTAEALPTGLSSTEVFRALARYHKLTSMKPVTPAQVEQLNAMRAEALDEALTELRKLTQATSNLAQLGVLAKYTSLCEKRNPRANWAKASTLSRSLQPASLGKLSPFSHRIALDAAKVRAGLTGSARSLAPEYWLEKLDPQHHSWRQGELGALFKKWKDDKSTPLGLWAWLEINGSDAAKQLQEKVIYLAPDKRWENAYTTDAEGLLRKRPTQAGVPGALLWTKQSNVKRMRTDGLQFYHSQLWAFVVSPGGGFYVHHHEADLFHHSSFLAGGRVLTAGMIGVSKGRIVYLSNKSGHYQPSPEDFHKGINAALKLNLTGLDLQGAVVDIFHGHDRYLAWADEWLAGGPSDYLARFQKLEGTEIHKSAWVLDRCKHLIEHEEAPTWLQMSPLARRLIWTAVQNSTVETETLDVRDKAGTVRRRTLRIGTLEWLAAKGQVPFKTITLFSTQGHNYYDVAVGSDREKELRARQYSEARGDVVDF